MDTSQGDQDHTRNDSSKKSCKSDPMNTLRGDQDYIQDAIQDEIQDGVQDDIKDTRGEVPSNPPIHHRQI